MNESTTPSTAPSGGAFPVANGAPGAVPPAGPPAPATFEPAPEKRSRKPIVAILALVTALLLGGGAFAVVRTLDGGGAQPSDALPGNALAYFRMDIDPSASQKISGFRFSEKLPPEVKRTLTDGDLRRKIFEAARKDSPELQGLDYTKDVEPWLGDRVGIAVVPGADRKPEPVISLQVKDQGKADATLSQVFAKMSRKPSFFFHEGFVVFTTPEARSTVEQQVTTNPLSKAGSFGGDMDALDGEGIASGWVNWSGIADAYPDTLRDTMQSGKVAPGTAPQYEQVIDSLRKAGRMSFALRLEPSYAELVAKTRGGQDTFNLAHRGAPVNLGRLPQGTAMAFGMSYDGDTVRSMWDRTVKQLVSDGQHPDEAIAKAEQQSGLKLPDDLVTLLGKGFTLALTDGDLTKLRSEHPPVVGILDTDPEQAQAIVGKLEQSAKEDGESPKQTLVRKAADGKLYLGVDQGAVDAVASGGTLSDQETFRLAVPQAEHPALVAFVDFDKIEPNYLSDLDDDQRNVLGALRGAGLTVDVGEHGDSTMTLRLVVN